MCLNNIVKLLFAMARKKKNFGFQKSVIDGTEHIFGTSMTEGLPSEYSYKKYLPDVLNQGSNPICVPCSLSAYINWQLNLSNGSKKDNKVAYYDIFKAKTTETADEGMTFKDGLRYLLHHGVKTSSGYFNIKSYAMVRNFLSLKNAIVMNGPCFGALPVYNYNDKFWTKLYGDTLMGYHAIAIVGYDSEGFIIRNSWGKSFGKNGYTTIPYEDFSKFVEIWTIVE